MDSDKHLGSWEDGAQGQTLGSLLRPIYKAPQLFWLDEADELKNIDLNSKCRDDKFPVSFSQTGGRSMSSLNKSRNRNQSTSRPHYQYDASGRVSCLGGKEGSHRLVVDRI
jgi:hypothetical protein